MQKTNFARNMALFIFFSELIYLAASFFVIYPFMGLSYKLIIKGMLIPMIAATSCIVIGSLLVYFIIKKVDYIHDYQKGQKRILINKYEKGLRIFFIILNFFGLPIIMTAMGFLTLNVDGLIRWSTIRFLIVNAFMPQTIGVLQIIFMNYKIKDVKISANITELSIKHKNSLKWSIFFSMFSFGFFIIINLLLFTVTREEKIACISNVAYYLNKDIEAECTNGEFKKLMDLAVNSIDNNVKDEALRIKNSWESNYFKNNLKDIIIFCTIIFLFFLIACYILATNFSSHITSINKKLKNMVNLEGDLTQLIVKTSNDDIGELQVQINNFIFNVNKYFYNIYKTALDIINNTINEQKNVENLIVSNKSIYNDFTKIGEELEKQASVSGETSNMTKKFIEMVDTNINKITDQSAMIEELNSSTVQLYKSIESISKITNEAFELGKKLKNTSQVSSDGILEMNDIIANVSQNSVKMSDIITTISNIADQTDMLAMNAAIEAAHAGEAGKGFAVVADEVRKLAENTTDQTKEIEVLLTKISSIINDSVEKSKNVKKSIEFMQNDSNSTITIINDINNYTQEQLAGTIENMKAIHELVDITSSIMQNLETQKEMNNTLLNVLRNMDYSTSKMKDVGNDLDQYFSKLNNNLDDFQEFCGSINEKLMNLHKSLSKIKFIESD